MNDANKEDSDSGHRGAIKSPQDFGAGIFLIIFAAIGYFGAMSLKFGQMRGIGPGLMPQVMALLLGAFGLLLVFWSFIHRGSLLERWAIRGPFFVLGAVLLFAATIRGFDFGALKMPALGLAVSGPLAVDVSAFADPDTRWSEVFTFAVVITLLCIGMFKFILKLPIPIAPWLLGY